MTTAVAVSLAIIAVALVFAGAVLLAAFWAAMTPIVPLAAAIALVLGARLASHLSAGAPPQPPVWVDPVPIPDDSGIVLDDTAGFDPTTPEQDQSAEPDIYVVSGPTSPEGCA